MAVILKEVNTDRSLKKFIRFPRRLYRGSPYWVPALFMDEWNTLHWKRNSAFEQCQAKYWLAYRGNKIVGRVAAIFLPQFVEKWNLPYVRFGWLDFIDDPAVSSALLGAVEKWAKEKGMNAVQGPMGFTDQDREGMLVEGFAELGTLATIYNHPYYPQHLEEMGYIKDVDWIEYQITVPPEPVERISKAAEAVLRRYRFHLLQVDDKKGLLPYAMEVFHLLDKEYAQLYGTVPLNEKQMQAYVDQYFGYVSPDLIPVVLNENNEVIAFGIVMNSLSRALQKAGGELFPFGFIYLMRALKKNDMADMYLIAIRSEYQGMGVNAVLMDQIHKACIRRGIRLAESNPELESNVNVQGHWKFFPHRQHKRRRCYLKHLDQVN